ncbi:MAG: hypothetical protein IMZ61_14825 [Planctomycetes bacterium]|nr:hypothetical protein [Planctomycetota bacterium]
MNLSAGIRCYLAFLQPFEPQDIHDIEVRFSLPFDKYIFKNFLSDNNIYLTSEAKRCDPWTIVIDRDRTILFAESLGSTESQLIKDIADVLKKNRLFD